jgi:hypothetical protein
MTLKFDSWFLEHHMRIERHLSKKNGNCLFESISCFIDDWRGKPFELQLKSIKFHRAPLGECQCG